MELQDFARMQLQDMEKDAFIAKGLGFLGGLLRRGAGAVAGATGRATGRLGQSWKATKGLMAQGYKAGLSPAQRAARDVAARKANMMQVAAKTTAGQKARLANKVKNASKPFWTPTKTIAAAGGTGLAGGAYLGSRSQPQQY